ncbi:hypothetical protein ABWH96_13650 [Marivirga tractuosa]|uniref:hypothetical protein n=1 Tax=Marivirga tractuosa TaxID=1006 RepID=UPI0035CEB4DD
MDKQRLTTLINQPEKIEETDFRELSKLKQEYPYFQAISPLITIGSKNYSPSSEKKLLQSAAIYALDRKHLKEILTKDYESSSTEKVDGQPQEQEIKVEEKNNLDNRIQQGQNRPEDYKETSSYSQIEVTPASSSHLPASFFDELFKEMEALKAEKENYKKTLDRFEAKKSKEEKPKTKAKTTSKTASKATSKKTTATKTSTTKKTTPKPKTSSAKKTSTSTTTAKSTTKKSTAAKPKESAKKTSSAKAKKTTKTAEKKPKKDEHDIIEEITSRKELKINDAHKKEQLNIINNFIEKEPVLTKRIDPDNQPNKQEAEDLSASSTNLSDDVVSETLAKLMIKQGRKQKAIDIYKKLIWKFPQKKTYFVEIIDELKKES